MELIACVEALKLLSGRHSPVPRSAYSKIVVFTDSAYVHDHVYQAESVWPQNNWMTSAGEPVRNPDLWKELIRCKQKLGRVDFRKVKGHSKNPHNKVVDKLAKASAAAASQTMMSPGIVRRKTTSGKTEAGSVKMRGQVETIRIIAAKNLRGQPHHTYKYEVVDPNSQDYHLIDDAFARDDTVNLRGAHTYEVRFAEPGRGRWIVEVIREIR